VSAEVRGGLVLGCVFCLLALLAGLVVEWWLLR
jgi:hypothetical protein